MSSRVSSFSEVATRDESRDLVAIPRFDAAVYEAPFPEPGVRLSLRTGLSIDVCT